MAYSISNDYFELISGTNITTSPVYKEAVESTGTTSGMNKLKKFLNSIDSLSKKPQVHDPRISGSKGNIKDFSGYEDIKNAIDFLHKNLKGVNGVKDCVTVFDALENWASLYQQGYTKKISMICLEYENALYMLVTSLSTIIATNMDVVANGTEIRVQKKSTSTHGVIEKTMKDLATQLGDRTHKDYLEELITLSEQPIHESVYTEAGTLGDVVDVIMIAKSAASGIARAGKTGANLIKSIRKSFFGIVPLIRSIIYMRYKKKADTIMALEEQMVFIARNIEQLENIKTMDPKKKEVIIKKQKAVIENYRKKSEKLRAELMETEKQAVQAIDKDTEAQKNSDDDLVLEAAIFTEGGRHFSQAAAKFGPPKNHLKPSRNLAASKIAEVRKDKRADDFLWIFGKKKKKEEEPKESEEDRQLRDAIIKACEEVKKENVMDAIKLNPGQEYGKDDDMSKRTATKIGGNAYWPKDELDSWPSYKGKPMYLLAQLNFDKLPKLEGFPTKGLLQCFIYSQEEYGKKESWKVVYWEKYDKEAAVEVPAANINEDSIEDRYPSVEGCYFPEVKKADDYINYCGDDLYNSIHDKLHAQGYPDNDPNINSMIYDIAYGYNSDTKIFDGGYGTKISGYPAYTQSDPGYISRDNCIQIIQLDSEAGMMWGDCGVAHFFIPKEDLKNLKFDKAEFYWDCC